MLYIVSFRLFGSTYGDPISLNKITRNLMSPLKIPHSYLYTYVQAQRNREKRERERPCDLIISINMRQKRKKEKKMKKKIRKFEASSRERTEHSRTLVLYF